MEILVKAYFRNKSAIDPVLHNEVLLMMIASAITSVDLLGTREKEVTVVCFDKAVLNVNLFIEIVLEKHPEGGNDGLFEMKNNLVVKFDPYLPLDRKKIRISVDAYPNS